MASFFTPLQARVLDLLLRHGLGGERNYFLTGGSALAEFDLHHRFSDDLDFFTQGRPDVRPDAEAVATWLREDGLEVDKVDLRSPAFARVHLLEPGTSERLVLDFGMEYHPIDPNRQVGDVPVDSYRDMSARKLVAFFERGAEEAKDGVDLFYLLTRGGWALQDLIALARHKTADFDGEDGLLVLAAQLIDGSEPAYLDRMRRLRYPPGGAPDFAEVGRRLRQEGEALLTRLQPG